jgi:hypothetical protein
MCSSKVTPRGQPAELSVTVVSGGEDVAVVVVATVTRGVGTFRTPANVLLQVTERVGVSARIAQHEDVVDDVAGGASVGARCEGGVEV